MRPQPGPGATPFPSPLHEQLVRAAQERLRQGPARTRHLAADGSPLYVNRLALETSPYLLQHAHNPVDWRPWGEEAFAAAREQARPVFLSIGYSTCHWCHVMEEESFEDPEIAELINQLFIPLKVDREERPDVDSIYMQAVQLLTGHGGWPMSVFLTPERKPFFAGTYFPARDGERGARVGFRTLLLELSRVYREQRPKAEESAAEIAQAVKENLSRAHPPSAESPAAMAEGAVIQCAESFDGQEGGLDRAPKFPSSLPLRFLLLHQARTGNRTAYEMAALSLEKMALGGLNDQLAGGFHRYSTDDLWLVPHFEKMLYDNALLAQAYLAGAQAAAQHGGDQGPRAALFSRTLSRTLAWMDREMSDADGGFFSATDADSEGEEGTAFVWTPEQLSAALGAEEAAAVGALWGVRPGGNFEGKSVLHLSRIPSPAEQERLDRAAQALLPVRNRRPQPLTDRKVIAAWNGLAISAFARAGLWVGRPDWVARAERAAEALLRVHRPSGVLLRTSLGGVARHPALLEDLSFVAQGLVDLFQATGEPRWLTAAQELHAELLARFATPAGSYFRTPVGHEELLAREVPQQDGAEPAGGSVAAQTLLTLAALTSDDALRERALGVVRAGSLLLSRAPLAVGELLVAVERMAGVEQELVILRPAGGSDEELLAAARPWLSERVAVVRAEVGAALPLALLEGRGLLSGRPTAYLCAGGICSLPTADPAALAAQLAAASGNH